MWTTLGQRLAIARCERRLTQQWIASEAGISRPQLANIEAGHSQPSVRSFAAICRAIGVTMDEVYWADNTA